MGNFEILKTISKLIDLKLDNLDFKINSKFYINQYKGKDLIDIKTFAIHSGDKNIPFMEILYRNGILELKSWYPDYSYNKLLNHDDNFKHLIIEDLSKIKSYSDEMEYTLTNSRLPDLFYFFDRFPGSFEAIVEFIESKNKNGENNE